MTSEKFDPRAADPLDAYLDAARAEAPQLSADLHARIVAAALPQPAPLPAKTDRWRGWFSGWAVSGLAGGVCAGLAGLWVGLVLPVDAMDVPLWMQDAVSYVDMVTMPLIGLDDPFLMGL